MDKYEKLYNEALERARKIHSEIVNNEIIGFPGQIEDIFPELRESEDERIRKAVVSLVYEMKGTYQSFAKVELVQMVDWLEKQKEKKPELVQHPPITFTFNSNASRDERLKAALLALLNSDLLKVKEGGYFTKQDLIEWVEKQKDSSWKPSEEQMEAIERASTNKYLSAKQFDILVSLYEQLKKL